MHVIFRLLVNANESSQKHHVQLENDPYTGIHTHIDVSYAI